MSQPDPGRSEPTLHLTDGGTDSAHDALSRPAGRDFYDIDRLVAHGVDMHKAWALYVEQHNNLRRHYGWRPHPADIRSEYASRLRLIASDWDTTVAAGLFPPDDRFIDVYTRVDAAVADTQAAWVARMDPTELAEHLRRVGPAGPHL